MITANLDDPDLSDNVKTINWLKSLGFLQEEIQNLYGEQAENDKK